MDALERICEMTECPVPPERLAECIVRCGYSPSDIEYAAANLAQWYDLELAGVRKLIGIYLREFADIFSGEVKFRVYMSTPAPVYLAYELNSTERIRALSAEFIVMTVLWGIFGFSAGGPCADGDCAGCALLENRRNLIERGNVPTPQALWSFGLLCDAAPKTDETVAAAMGIPAISSFCSKSGDDRFARYEDAMRSGLDEFASLSGVRIGESAEAWNTWRRVSVLAVSITCYNNSRPAPPLKAGTIALIQSVLLTPLGDGTELADALDVIRRELRRLPDGAPAVKLYCYYLPPCIPEYGEIFSEAGITLIGSGAFISLPNRFCCSGDMAGRVAASWQSCVLSRPPAENASAVAKAIRRYGCEGYLTGMFFFDRWLGPGQTLIAEGIEAATGKSVYFHETDFWGKGFDRERARTYAETLAATLTAKSER